MRSLVILRGSPGAGKSTWIKKMGLENYTLCADTIRMLVESPIITPEGYTISQKNDGYVWGLLFELLEKRMSRGEFVIVDATHSRSSDFSKYNSLCSKYRYRKYYVDFSDVDIETCKYQNLLRPDYKVVPEKVIDKIYSRLRTQQKTSGWVEINRNNFWEEIGVKCFDFNKYDKVHIIGDIHGCFSALAEYLNPLILEDNFENQMIIFCGDYLDRGIENDKTLRLLIELSKLPNVLFLEGNHEKWLRMYSSDEITEIKSKQFLYKTMPQIRDIDCAEIRTFCRKIGQIAFFKYDEKIYLVSHGGLSYLPDELQLVATEQFINGVGDYNVDIDKIWSDKQDDTNIIQVHGHRNTYEIDESKELSYNLEGKIEFGGFLKVLCLEKNKKPIIKKVKNNVFGKIEDSNYFQERNNPNTSSSIIYDLQHSDSIKETKLTDTISSFNFTRLAFYRKYWNNITTKARGLFIDLKREKVVARGYEKFFNIGERRETEITTLATKFKNKKIVCFEKYNGFLGIMSCIDDELFIASKSTNKGEYATYFKTIFDNSDINKEVLKNYLKENDVSLTFEVIDPVNDPHVIEYDKPHLVLLDIIKNEFDFHKMPYEEVVKLGKDINCEYKKIFKEFDNFRDFHIWYLEETDEDNMSKNNLEGVVVECDGFMTKLKFPYYKFWKFMRGVKESISKKHNIKLSCLYNDEANYFYNYCKGLSEEELSKSIIDIRKQYEEGKKS